MSFKLPLKKTELTGLNDVLRYGFVCESLELIEREEFHNWFEKTAVLSKIKTYSSSQNTNCFQYLRIPKSSMLSKRFIEDMKYLKIMLSFSMAKISLVQLGEWYAKCIFGLRQTKSTSQRGFDFSPVKIESK